MNTTTSQGDTDMNTTTTNDFAAEYDKLQEFAQLQLDTIARLAVEHDQLAGTDLIADGQINYGNVAAMREAVGFLGMAITVIADALNDVG